jgi:hypothetical protein
VSFFGISRYNKSLQEAQDLINDKDADKIHDLVKRGMSYISARKKVKGEVKDEKVSSAEERRTGNRNTDSDPVIP